MRFSGEHVDESFAAVDALDDMLLDLQREIVVSMRGSTRGRGRRGRRKGNEEEEETHLDLSALDELGDDALELGEVVLGDDKACGEEV